MKKITFLILIALTFTGCETVVDIDVPIEERILVVNALNNPDSTWRVRLSLSRHVLDDAPYKVPDQASVSIFDAETNTLVDQLTTSPNAFFYTGSVKPLPGKEYRLRVTTSKYGSAESSVIFPEPVPIAKVEFDSIPSQPGTGPISSEDTFPVKIFFKDPGGMANYYRITASARSWYLRMVDQTTADTIWYENQINLKVNDPSLQSDYNVNGPVFFDDTLFDGNERVLTLGIPRYTFHFSNATQIRIVMSSLTESYYRYATTSNLQQATSGDPFAQPVLVYNNIQNGLGIFGGFTQSVWVFKN